jgi:hypothetical protein
MTLFTVAGTTASAEGLRACPVEPFAEEALNVRESVLREGCGGDHWNWNVETPRAKESDPGPSVVRTGFDTVASEPLVPGMLGTVRMSWAGMRDEELGGLTTERATVAAGTLWRMSEDFAVQMNFGRELTGIPRSRATVAGVWSPIDAGLVFAEWAGTPEGTTENHRLGARWWLLPGHLSVDFSARQLPDSPGWVDHRYGLTFTLPTNALR